MNDNYILTQNLTFSKKHNPNALYDISASHLYKKIINDDLIQNSIDNGSLFGEICFYKGLPEKRYDKLEIIDSKNICCKILKIELINKNSLLVSVELIGNKGEYVKSMIEKGIDVHLSPRKINSDDGKDYKFITFDILIFLEIRCCIECFYESLKSPEKFEKLINDEINFRNSNEISRIQKEGREFLKTLGGLKL